MLYYKYRLRPTSSFATYPASDTVLGQLCCMLKFQGANLDELLKDYETDPFAVTSCMLPQGMGNAIQMPKERLIGNKQEKIAAMLKRKEEKAKNKISVENVFKDRIRDNEKMGISKEMEIVRNSISRISGTTEGEAFSPYSVIETFYNESAYFDLYIYVKEEYRELVRKGIELMGEHGFGKDASVGKGRFEVEKADEEFPIDKKSYNAVYTLGNCVLEGIVCKKMYYNICTRFGKHGAGADNPFKNPVVMAKQGALLYMQDIKKPYIGKALRGLSYCKNTVHQGYSLYIPVVDVKDE